MYNPIKKQIYQFNRVWLLLVMALLMVWPLSALADDIATTALKGLGLQAPFLSSWTTLWFFSIGGGIMSNFVKLDIDAELKAVYIAKPFMGILFSMSVIMWLNGEADPPNSSHALSALGSSFVGAPLMQGLLVQLTKGNNIQKIFDKLAKKFIGD